MKTKISYNPGWFSLVGVIFVIAKILEFGVVATWSWWLVLLPFYFGLAILFGGAIIASLGLIGWHGIAAIYSEYKTMKSRKN